MNLDGISPLIHFAIGLPLWGLIFFKLIPRVHREDFQQHLFRVRNDLFEFAWRNGHDFSDPAYADLRNSLNGGIRWAEKLDVPTLFAVALVSWFAKMPKSRIHQTANKALDEEIGRARAAMQRHCFRFVWFSFWGAVAFLPLLAAAIVVVFAAPLAGTFGRIFYRLQIVIRSAFERPVAVFVEESQRIGHEQLNCMAVH